MTASRPPVLRAAVVGVGAFGRHHARIFSEMADVGVRLVGLVDVGGEGPRALAERLDVPLAREIADLPEPVDLVSVAVPTTLHRAVAEPLLRAGIHCLVEKPIAGSTADAEALVKAAADGGAHLQVGHVERFNPVTAALDRLGESPIYVEAHRLAPYRERERDVGVVMDLMIHDLDIINHVVAEEPGEVTAVAASHAGAPGSGNGSVEDLANARIAWPSGCVAHVTASRMAAKRLRRTRIFTETGYLSLDYDKREARLMRPQGGGRDWLRDVRGLAGREAGLADALTGGHRPTFEEVLCTDSLPIGEGEPLRAELEAMVGCVRSGHRPLVGGVEGLRALALAERILLDGLRRPAASGA